MDDIQSQIPKSDTSDDESTGEPDEFQATQALLEEDNHEQCINNFKAAMEKHNVDMDSLKQYIEWLQSRDSNQIERIQKALNESGITLTQVKAYVWWAEKKIKKK
jgi:hypothetical protein